MTPLRRIILDEVQVASKKQPNEFGYKSDDSGKFSLSYIYAYTLLLICLALYSTDEPNYDMPSIDHHDISTTLIIKFVFFSIWEYT